ncbi:MAG: DUF6503 family protein [Bacteroidota bacterium]
MISLACLMSCGENAGPVTQPANSLPQQIEMAHQKEAFLANEAVQWDFKLSFGGKERMDATLTILTNSTKGLLEMADSTQIFFDGDRVYYSPNRESDRGVRFDAFTWSYFFLLPYKLTDPGTKWSPYNETPIAGKSYRSEKLSFEASVGDAPDDWYIVYANPSTDLLEVAAYIVTANKSVEKAEEDPHAIEYADFTTVEGIPFARRWVFWEWREEKGLTQELGYGEVSNIRLLADAPMLDQVPKGFIEVPK